MLWAAHCLAVAALSAMEIRAIDIAKKRQQQHEQDGGNPGLSFDATLQQLLHSPPPTARAKHEEIPRETSVISSAHLKRQMLAHLIDFPLAARSAGIQVAA
jgi:hypothetical protein